MTNGTTGTGADGPHWDRDEPSATPTAAVILRLVAVVAVVAAVLAALVGVWKAQTQGVSRDKAAERQAHERAYGQLDNPSGVGAARVRNITITDAQVQTGRDAATGTLSFRVYNSGPTARLTGITVTVRGATVPRVLFVPGAGAEPQPLPAGGLTIATGEEVTFRPGGMAFALIGLPRDTAGMRARVTASFTDVGAVTFEAPVRR